MRLTRLAVLAVAFSASLGTVAEAAPTCPPEAVQVEPVRRTILAIYEALTRDDDKALGQLLAPSFHAFENGKRFEGAALTALIKDAHARGVVFRWSPQNIEIHVRCDMAWAAWENHGAVGPKDDMKPVSWLESATFGYRDGRWVMDFLHANRVAAAP
jgi:hypothetical protein